MDARGPVGILEGPPVAAEAGGGPDRWRDGAEFHPPLPPRDEKEDPLFNGM